MAGEVPTIQLDLTSPAGTQDISLGDNRIREAKTQFQEILNVDHDVPTTAYASDVGQHKKVTLQEQDNLGTGAVGTTILGSQTIATRGELVYTNEDDADIQLTKGATTYPSQSTTLADWSKIMGLVYPVGSIYANYAVATNPGTLLGVGTWTAIEEQVIAGYKSGGTFGTIGSLATGTETVTLTSAQSGVPAHTHGGIAVAPPASGANYGDGAGGPFTKAGSTSANSAANAASAHNNIQPTYVAYLWRRTA